MTDHPRPTITVNVDVTNPGQFFACCGLLELADRLWPGAEGWFQQKQFCITSSGTLQQILEKLAEAKLISSLSDQQLKRLGTLLSAKKSTLSAADQAEKDDLRERWRQERIHLEAPFDLWLDWWRNGKGDRTPLKTWAAKQFVLEIARPLLAAANAICTANASDDVFLRTAKVSGLPFYFDSDANSQHTARDTGFGLYTLRHIIATREATRPLLEICGFFGMQRFLPEVVRSRRTFRFDVWVAPLPCAIAAVAASRVLRLPGSVSYEFGLLDRSEYMKAFLPAKPCSRRLE